nr:uncharacterized protein LOC109767802 [Aegilops tauschii subsp. strangulata]
MMQILPSHSEANVVYMPDREVSDVADPDLGAAALEDDARGGCGGAVGSVGGGGVEDWSDDEEEEQVPRHPLPSDRVGPSSSAAPTAPGGGSKRRGVLLFGSHPKKPKHWAAAAKNMAAATKWREAAAKATKFQKAPKKPPMVSALRHRGGKGSTNNRCIDPVADLQEAQERNAREVREEKEAAAKKAEADKAAAAKAAQADADATAKAQADTVAKKRAEDAARQQIPQLITPLHSAPPAPEISAPAGGASNEQPVVERERGDAVLPEMEAPPQPPTADGQGSQPAAPLVPPAGGELVVGSAPTARTLVRRRVEKAASALRPMEVGSASSSALDAEATSVVPTEWVHGGGTSALIKVAQDVQADFKAEAAALSQCMKAFVKTRATVRDYHNVRAATFNAHVRELDRRTADLAESRIANAALQQQLGEANTVLCAKEEECNRAAHERDRLAKELKDQAELHKAALKQAEDNEARLLAEFETEHSDFFPGHSVAANQAIEARREERWAEGAEIATNAPRTLGEQLLGIQARLRPAQRMLHRLQRAGAQAISALWLDRQTPRTPNRTADSFKVAAGRLEAWKGSAARAGAWRALEFTKAWYPGLDLGQLATFRKEASAELVPVERDLTLRAAAIAEYTNTGIFVPELTVYGAEVPPEWPTSSAKKRKEDAAAVPSVEKGGNSARISPADRPRKAKRSIAAWTEDQYEAAAAAVQDQVGAFLRRFCGFVFAPLSGVVDLVAGGEGEDKIAPEGAPSAGDGNV